MIFNKFLLMVLSLILCCLKKIETKIEAIKLRMINTELKAMNRIFKSDSLTVPPLHDPLTPNERFPFKDQDPFPE